MLADGSNLVHLPPENLAYSAGSTTSVSTVAVSSPPMTTVASGFCTPRPSRCIQRFWPLPSRPIARSKSKALPIRLHFGPSQFLFGLRTDGTAMSAL